MKRPTLKLRRDLHRNGQTFAEVFSKELKAGCMVCVREAPGGGVMLPRLVIEAYAGDADVFVRINGRDYRVPK